MTPAVSHGVLLTLAYDGEKFSGWAAQKDARTVEETLQAAIVQMDPDASPPRGASRTDAGVHAEGQLVAFDSARAIEARGWVLGLNAALPDDVAVRAARAVPPEFDPRRASRGKRYRYRVLLDRVRDPLARSRTWRIGFHVDVDKMIREAALAEGTHDYRAFRSAHDKRVVTVRTLQRVAVERETDRVVAVVVDGSGFMHHMVRIIAGTLVDVGRGIIEEGAITRAIASGERADLGTTAPAFGLVLERIIIEEPAPCPVTKNDPWPR